MKLENIIVLISIIAYIFTCVNIYVKVQKSRIQLEEYKTNMCIDINTEKVVEELNSFISSVCMEYIIIKVEILDIDFINSEFEIKIREECGGLVSRQISPVFIDKLCLVYNKEEVGGVIGTKVYMYICNYVLQKNAIRGKK